MGERFLGRSMPLTFGPGLRKMLEHKPCLSRSDVWGETPPRNNGRSTKPAGTARPSALLQGGQGFAGCPSWARPVPVRPVLSLPFVSCGVVWVVSEWAGYATMHDAGGCERESEDGRWGYVLFAAFIRGSCDENRVFPTLLQHTEVVVLSALAGHCKVERQPARVRHL